MMRELDDALRAVEATLFAADDPLGAAEIALYVGCRAIMPGAGSSWSSAAAAGISRPPPISPIS